MRKVYRSLVHNFARSFDSNLPEAPSSNESFNGDGLEIEGEEDAIVNDRGEPVFADASETAVGDEDAGSQTSPSSLSVRKS